MKKCADCLRLHKTYHSGLKAYYLNQPCDCICNDETKYSEECESYVSPDQGEWHDQYGIILNWIRKNNDSPIYPKQDEAYIVTRSGFLSGFDMAVKLLQDLNGAKQCSICELSNPHIVNKCTGVEVCERFKYDGARCWDALVYGNLCTSCIREKCDRKDYTLCPTYRVTECKRWIIKDFTENEMINGKEKE